MCDLSSDVCSSDLDSSDPSLVSKSSQSLPCPSSSILPLTQAGFMRIPVYRRSRESVVGFITLAQVLTAPTTTPTSVAFSLAHHLTRRMRLMSLELDRLPIIALDAPLYSLLNIFLSTKAKMALV